VPKEYVVKIEDYDGTIEKDRKDEICANYFTDKTASFVFGMAVSFVIIGVNFVLKKVIILLVEKIIREDTKSEQLSTITNYVFYAQFFNTAILILLVNANLSEHNWIPFNDTIDFKYYDYVPEWYVDVG